MWFKLGIVFLLLVTSSTLPARKKCVQIYEKSSGEECCLRSDNCECLAEKVCQGPSKRFLDALFGDCGLFDCSKSRFLNQELGSPQAKNGRWRKKHRKLKHLNRLEDQWDPSLFETGLDN